MPHACTAPPVCFIAPPQLLDELAKHGTPAQRASALRTIAASATFRAQRATVGKVMRALQVDVRELGFVAPPPGERRTVYDAHHGGQDDLPGTKVRAEGAPESKDAAVNEAYDGADATYDLYKDVYGRDSVDGKGLELVSSVHYGVDFNNAFWNGGEMVYGDGDGELFIRGGLTKAIDVIGHELTHGVTQFTAGLDYAKQPGALNESFSDVFGSLVKQYHLKQDAAAADWLIGAGILAPGLGKALRSMKAPGTAFAQDTQPATMAGYQDLPDDNDPANDNGGVHLNSGIPNHAFYLAATALGGNAWELAGRVWYVTLTEKLKPTSDFAHAAAATVEVAKQVGGAAAQRALEGAWTTVGVL